MKHDGYTNKYSFVFHERPITLVPMTPKQVYNDQVRLQKESDDKRENERKKKSENQREVEKNNREKEKKRGKTEKRSLL